MLMKGGGAGRPHAQRPYPGRPGRVPMGAAGVAAEAAPRPGADAAPRTGQRVLELELELIQTQMTQKPMLRAEVYAHAMRASQNRKEEVCWGRGV